jgi:hypothetical protein
MRNNPAFRREGPPVLFRVQVLVSDCWMLLDGADRLSRDEAHVRCAREASMAGEHRVRMVPLPRDEAEIILRHRQP